MKKKILKLVLCGLLMAGLVFADLWTKQWAVRTLLWESKTIVLIPGVFELSYVENTGMAFGLLKNAQWFFYIATGLFIAVGLFLLVKTPETKRFLPMNLILTLIIAGAIGNMIDRLSKHYVVDFLYFSLIDFPVFNVADCYVTVGIILLTVFLLFVYKDDELKKSYSLKK